MANDNLFHPYKVITQSPSSLQLVAGNSVKVMRIIFLAAPLILLGAGIALYITQKEIFFLYIFSGIALLEYIFFSFIKVPANVQMDNIGFTLQTASIKGLKQTDYLWNDVDFIRQRTSQVKNTTTLNYQAFLLNGKKITFLVFPNYSGDKTRADQINTTLTTISKKEVRQKI